MRRLLVMLVTVAGLTAPAAASAATETATSGGVTATISYTGGLGITIKDLRISISQRGTVVYNEPIKSGISYEVFSPTATKGAVHVVDLAGDGEREVVVDLWSGGADCCTIEQVYSPSTALGSYVLTQRNFGNYGDVLERLGPQKGAEFVSGDNDFYCTFAGCAASGLPLQIESFSGLAFHDVTRHYPALIAQDAARWWRLYTKHTNDGLGLIAAWAADEDRLGNRSTVDARLAEQVSQHHVTMNFVRELNRFLKKHGYID